MKNIYLICPVRNVTDVNKANAIRDYVGILEQEAGVKVHFPPRDVDQSNDDGGLRIVEAHLEAMAQADEVHVWWDRESTGSHFDLGMAYMLKAMSKRHIPVVVANGVGPVPEKSYQNLLVHLAQEERPAPLPLWQDEQDSGEGFLEHLEGLGAADAAGLRKAYEAYGPSWKSRGGVGAFMMLARKWDRLENRVERLGWDVFRAIVEDTRREGAIDDVRDLRRYLMLVEAEMVARGYAGPQHRDNAK